MSNETRTRSLLKALTWRLLGTCLTVAIAFVFTRRVGVAAAFGAADFLLKSLFYFIHERWWSSIPLGKRETEPRVIWLTGLSGAGKTTLALQLVKSYEQQGIKVQHLDGDTIRKMFPDTGFSREQRIQHIKRVGLLASILEANGITVIASFISPHEEGRQFVKQFCRKFVEIHVSTTLAVCEGRDPKGLYAKARRGEIRDFTGIDSVYENPLSPHLTIDTSDKTIEESTHLILEALRPPETRPFTQKTLSYDFS